MSVCLHQAQPSPSSSLWEFWADRTPQLSPQTPGMGSWRGEEGLQTGPSSWRGEQAAPGDGEAGISWAMSASLSCPMVTLLQFPLFGESLLREGWPLWCPGEGPERGPTDEYKSLIPQMTVPLLLQGELSLVERYVADFPELQHRLLGLMDAWCQPGFRISFLLR